jgi:hypothetical protein
MNARLGLVLAAAVCASCATKTETVLKNPNGDVRYCYLVNDHTLTSAGAVTEYNRCLNEAGAAGYRQVQ